MSYPIGTVMVCRNHYLDLLVAGHEYKVDSIENLLGENHYYLLDTVTGKRTDGNWPFKEWELKLYMLIK